MPTPRKSSAASLIVSESVGCVKIVSAISSAVASRCIAMAAAAIKTFAQNQIKKIGDKVAKLEGKGRDRTIKFIGIDALPSEGVRYVKDGILTATFEYPTGGAEAIENALRILNGQKVEKNIILGTRVFTKENADKGGEVL